MRHEELKGPLTGWTYDTEGVIHTRSGYRATAQQIESALWLLGCWSSESRKYWIHSDEGTGALRRLHETSDYASDRQPEKAVLRDGMVTRTEAPTHHRTTARTRHAARIKSRPRRGFAPTPPLSTTRPRRSTRGRL